MMGDNLKRAQSHLKQAVKKSKSGWLSKPEWFLAASEFDNAANAFNMGGHYEKAAECWVKSAEAHNKDENYYQSAILYEKAGNTLYNKLKDPVKASQHMQEASHYFRLKDSADRAAKAMEKAGDMVSEIDPIEASKLYVKGVHILKDENRGRLALDTYYKTLSFLVVNSRKREASEVKDIIIDTCRQLAKEGRNDAFVINKGFLSLAVVSLYSGNLKEAEEIIQLFGIKGRDGIGFSNHMSREYEGASRLLEAYKNHDQDELRKVVADLNVLIPYPSVGQLANQISVGKGGYNAANSLNENSNYNPFKPTNEENNSHKGLENNNDDDDLL